MAEATEALGGLDVLVNNVGGSAGGRKRLEEDNDAEWQRTFEMNLFHSVRMTRLAVPHLRRRGGGAVVTVSSISGWLPGGILEYGCAKAAEETFMAGGAGAGILRETTSASTRSAPARSYSPEAAGERFRQANPEQFEEWLKREFPLGRLGLTRT